MSFLAFCTDVKAWHGDRRKCRRAGSELPVFASYIDIKADLLVLVTRVFLGAISGALFHDEVVAAIGVGAAAPALLSQFKDDSSSNSALDVVPDSSADPGRIPAPASLVPQPRRPRGRPGSPAMPRYQPRHTRAPSMQGDGGAGPGEHVREAPEVPE